MKPHTKEQTKQDPYSPKVDFTLIQTFTPQQRKIAWRFWIKKKTLKEISEELGKSESWISTQLHNSRNKLGLTRFQYFGKNNMGEMYEQCLKEFKRWEQYGIKEEAQQEQEED